MTETGLVATALIPELMVSKNKVKDLQAPALSAVDLGAAGMLGVDSLQSQRVTFDFARKTMSIRASRGWAVDRDPNTIVVTARSHYGRLLITQASVDGERIVVVLDTGSQITIGNEALRRKLAARKKLGRMHPVELISVTGGTTQVDYTAVKRISIGGVEIRDMPIGFANVQPFRQLRLEDRPALLLGMDALKLFDRVSVDFARKEVRFLAPDLSAGAVAIRMAAAKSGEVAPLS
jgi:predicted aspartyl protease